MKTKGYLIVGKRGSLKAVKSLRSDIGFDEVAIALDLEIPDEAFKPIIEAHIKIDKKDISPLLIDTGELSGLSEKLSHEIGLNVRLTKVDECYDEK